MTKNTMTDKNYNRDEAARLYQKALNCGEWTAATQLRELIERHGG